MKRLYKNGGKEGREGKGVAAEGGHSHNHRREGDGIENSAYMRQGAQKSGGNKESHSTQQHQACPCLAYEGSKNAPHREKVCSQPTSKAAKAEPYAVLRGKKTR